MRVRTSIAQARSIDGTVSLRELPDDAGVRYRHSFPETQNAREPSDLRAGGRDPGSMIKKNDKNVLKNCEYLTFSHPESVGCAVNVYDERLLKMQAPFAERGANGFYHLRAQALIRLISLDDRITLSLFTAVDHSRRGILDTSTPCIYATSFFCL